MTWKKTETLGEMEKKEKYASRDIEPDTDRKSDEITFWVLKIKRWSQ